jgi:hypothetical protein
MQNPPAQQARNAVPLWFIPVPAIRRNETFCPAVCPASSRRNAVRQRQRPPWPDGQRERAARDAAVLEDSRCPEQALCVWAGRVRINARVRLGRDAALRELELGKPVQVADGALTLVAVTPGKMQGQALAPGRYRFAFTFAGGL